MGRNQCQTKNPETKYETEEYEEVVQIDDNFNPNFASKQQMDNMNELFRKSYANLDEIKSKLENLEHYSSKLCLAGENSSPCPFYHQAKNERHHPDDTYYYNTEGRPQCTSISPHNYVDETNELSKADVVISSDPSDLNSNVLPTERIIIDLTPQSVDGNGGVTIKHTSNKYTYSQQHTYKPKKIYKNPNEATFYVMNDAPVNNPQPRRRITSSHTTNPQYIHPIHNNNNYTPPPPPKKKKKKSSFLNCCKKK